MPQPVVITPYDPAWPQVFAALQARLAAGLGQVAVAIEHVGSTAVPGLAAKPVIDIDIVIASAADLPLASERLASLGYAYKGEQGIVGRHAFKRPADAPEHHLYVCAADNLELRRHLAFRDHLRANPADADAYAQLKVELAQHFREDREGYSQAKSAFVEDILRKAPARSGVLAAGS